MKIKLQEILDSRNISVYSLSKEIGVTQNNLGKLIKGETTSIKYDILEKLCNILDITPNDIFEIEPQLTLFNYDKFNKKQTLLSQDTLDIIKNINRDSNNSALINEDVSAYDEYIDRMAEQQEKKQKEDEENYQTYLDNKEELDKFFNESQKRFDSELNLDKLISKFIDNILSGLFTNLDFEPSIQLVFKKYKGHDYFTTNLKVETFYNNFYRFLRHYSDDKKFITIIDDIQHIYKNGGLSKLTDDEIENLQKIIQFYLNNDTQQKTR
jgi:putative transcriptional regulator